MKSLSFVFLGENGCRLDVALTHELTFLTRSKVSSLAVKVLVNGKNAKMSCKLKKKDRVDYEWKELPEISVAPCDLNLNVVYEDENVIVINKEQNMVTHPSHSSPNGTLLNALNYYRLYKSKWKDEFSFICLSPKACNKMLPKNQGDIFRLGIVHRLDKDTSGIILTARNLKTQMFLKNEFKRHRVRKFYVALLEGIPKEERSTIRTSIFRSKKDGRRFVASSNLEKGRLAVSRYKVLKRFGNVSLVVFRIYTGRTHQIRVHAKYIGCPVLGDGFYGKSLSGLSLFLHSYKLEVNICFGTHKVFKAPLPNRFKKMIRLLKNE